MVPHVHHYKLKRKKPSSPIIVYRKQLVSLMLVLNRNIYENERISQKFVIHLLLKSDWGEKKKQRENKKLVIFCL